MTAVGPPLRWPAGVTVKPHGGLRPPCLTSRNDGRYSRPQPARYPACRSLL